MLKLLVVLRTWRFEELTEETSSRERLRVMRPGSGMSPTGRLTNVDGYNLIVVINIALCFI